MRQTNKSIAIRGCEGVHEAIIEITPRYSENEVIRSRSMIVVFVA